MKLTPKVARSALPSNRPEDLLPEYVGAYKALPECYRADSCLKFYQKVEVVVGGFSGEMKCTLYADYDLGETYIWTGRWERKY